MEAHDYGTGWVFGTLTFWFHCPEENDLFGSCQCIWGTVCGDITI